MIDANGDIDEDVTHMIAIGWLNGRQHLEFFVIKNTD